MRGSMQTSLSVTGRDEPVCALCASPSPVHARERSPDVARALLADGRGLLDWHGAFGDERQSATLGVTVEMLSEYQGNGEEGGVGHAVIVPRAPGERREPWPADIGNARRFACLPIGARLGLPFPQPATPPRGSGSAAGGR